MSTIVVHHGALGDSVLIWPVLRALGSATLVCGRDKARLAAHWIEGVEPVDGESPEWTRLFAPGAEHEAGDALRKRLIAARRIISFVSTGDDVWARNIEKLAPDAGLYIVDPRPDEASHAHVTEYHAWQLADQGIDLPRLQTPARANPDGPVVIHPGSGGEHKCWPRLRYEMLIDHLQSIGREVRMVVGEAERQRWGFWVEVMRSRCEVTDPADLIELSRRIADAGLYVGNDSGPTHLAGQLGVSTLALFGPTHPRLWSPLGPAVRVLWPGRCEPMEWLSVSRVVEAVASG